VCVIREQMILQIILTWTKLTRGWDELGSFYNLLVVLNQILKTMYLRKSNEKFVLVHFQ